MTMIEGMIADIIVVTMISDMIAITVAIVTIETTDPFLPVPERKSPALGRNAVQLSECRPL
jgi:hypothetical protein